eukprot:EG_transcript_26888
MPFRLCIALPVTLYPVFQAQSRKSICNFRPPYSTAYHNLGLKLAPALLGSLGPLSAGRLLGLPSQAKPVDVNVAPPELAPRVVGPNGLPSGHRLSAPFSFPPAQVLALPAPPHSPPPPLSPPTPLVYHPPLGVASRRLKQPYPYPP